MKRAKLIVAMAIVCIVSLCATLFAGCKGGKLSTPKGLSYSEGRFSWDEVKDANGYIVAVNDKSEFFIESASLSYNNPKLKGALADKSVNTLCVVAVTVDDEGHVTRHSDPAQYEFDYVTPVVNEWIVTLDLNYSGAPQAQTVAVRSGGKLTKPDDPQRNGWKFDGWCRDKLCLVKADFADMGASNFTITADTTLYAKWILDKTVTKTPIYFYSEDWTEVQVRPFKGETALFDGSGVTMAAVAGKPNWFKAEIDDTATSVIFASGEEATQSATFDKAKPYCKDGAWTATYPVDQPVDPIVHVVSIKVNDAEEQKLAANPKVNGEYTIELELAIDDEVVITMDGKAVTNYSADCGFTGTVTIEGKHTFFVSEERIWVDMPAAPSAVILIINGDTENAKGLEENPNDNPTIEIEYSVKVTLKQGDTIKIMAGGVENKNYEAGCGFTGTVTLDGEYTFYVKKYKDDRADSIWVTVPREVTTTSTKVYYHNTVKGHKLTTVYLYCWSESPQKDNKWPGVKMTDLGNDWFMLEIEAGYSMIIFDNGNGGTGNQTGDLVLEVVNGCAYYDFNGVTEDRPSEE